MSRWRSLGLLLALAVSSTATAEQAPTTLTLDQALTVALDRAPELRLAELRAQAVRGSARGAGAPPNPELEAGLGRRGDGPLEELELGISQPLPIGTMLPSRAVAQADAVGAERWAEDTRRRVAARVAAAFLRVLHARERLVLDRELAARAVELRNATALRARIGDASELDATMAELDAARAEARVLETKATLTEHHAALATVLGLGSEVELVLDGPLLDRDRYAAALVGDLQDRADLMALEAGIEGAEAARRKALGETLPELGVWGHHAIEEGDEVWMAGLSVEVPLFDRAQGERAASHARLELAELALDEGTRTARVEHSAASEAYTLRLAAAELLGTGVLPRAARQSEAVGSAYELGQIPLTELLMVRAQAADAQREHLDAELAAALAGTALLEAAGWTP
jgi:outer membrane protein, heavy metal efflux system